MDAQGNATVTWRRSNGANYIVQARRIDALGVPGAGGDLSATGQNAFYPGVAVDAQGNATVTWDRFNGTSFVVQARRIDASGGLGAVQDLSATGQASKPLVVVDAQGNATVTWEDQGTN